MFPGRCALWLQILMLSFSCVWILAQESTREPHSESTSEVAPPPEELASPRATMDTFLHAMFDVKQGKQGIQQAIACLDLSEITPVAQAAAGQKAAEDLSFCLDRLEYIDVEDIPDDMGDDGKWIYCVTPFSIGDQSFKAEISIALSKDGAWRFTPITVATIGQFREHLKNTEVVDGVMESQDWRTTMEKRFPWLARRVLLIANWQWLVLLTLIILAALVERLVSLAIRGLASRWLSQRRVEFNIEKQQRFLIPFRVLSYVVVLYAGLHFSRLPTDYLTFLLETGLVVLTIAVVWCAINIIDLVASYFYEVARTSENRFDDLLVPLIHRSVRLVVFVFGILFVAQNMGQDITTLLTGLGIGGLAVALAAKDTLANLFGSLTVLVDRPFQIGDWVVIGSNIEGVVEQVGFRSTRVRTFYDSLITVPNSSLTNNAIDNYGHRRYRRLSCKLGIEYRTPPQKVEAFCEGIRQIILAHPWTRKDYFHVYFNGFGDSALEILLYVFWEVPDWSKELAERHRLLLDILRLGQELGVGFAFPTRTLHMFQETAPQDHPLADSPHAAGKAFGRRIAEHTLTMRNPRSGASNGDFPDDKPSL